MPTASQRNVAFGGIISVASMSFLTGIFLMMGVQKFALGDHQYIMALVVIPLLIFAAVLNARRILKAVADGP